MAQQNLGLHWGQSIFNYIQKKRNYVLKIISSGDLCMKCLLYSKLPENPNWDLMLNYPFENGKDIDVTISIAIT